MNITTCVISMMIDCKSVARIWRNVVLCVKILNVFWKMFTNLTSGDNNLACRSVCVVELLVSVINCVLYFVFIAVNLFIRFVRFQHNSVLTLQNLIRTLECVTELNGV